MKTVSKQEFEADVRAVEAAAADQPVAIGEADSPEFVLLTMQEYLRLKDRDRKVYAIDEIPDDILEALARVADEPYETS